MLFVVWGDSRVLGVNQELRSYLLLDIELLVGRMIDSCFGPMDCLLFFGGFGWSEILEFQESLIYPFIFFKTVNCLASLWACPMGTFGGVLISGLEKGLAGCLALRALYFPFSLFGRISHSFLL